MITVEMRRKYVKRALVRYKSGKSSPEERQILENAMKAYKETLTEDYQKKTYNILLCVYFADKTISTKQISRKFHIEYATTYKDINRGVKDLTTLIFGIDGIENN